MVCLNHIRALHLSITIEIARGTAMMASIHHKLIVSESRRPNRESVQKHQCFLSSLSRAVHQCFPMFSLKFIMGWQPGVVHHHGLCKSLSLVVHNLRNLLKKSALAPENLEINWCRPQIWRSYENMRELQKYLGDVKIWGRSQVKACTSNFCNCARLWNCRFPLIVFELEGQSSNISPWSKLHIFDFSFREMFRHYLIANIVQSHPID